jgi:transposase
VNDLLCLFIKQVTEVITRALIGKIRGMYFRDGKSISEIARLTSLTRNTIKKWLKRAQGTAPKYRRCEVPKKLTPYLASLTQALEVNAGRVKRERRSARALHAQLAGEGYQGGYTRLTDFIRTWQDKQGKLISAQAFVPLTFAPGEAFQFDWSEEALVIGGIYRRMQVSHMKLCASRAFWLVAYPSQGHEMLFDAHTRSFTALGGIPRRGISSTASGRQRPLR